MLTVTQYRTPEYLEYVGDVHLDLFTIYLMPMKTLSFMKMDVIFTDLQYEQVCGMKMKKSRVQQNQFKSN